MHEVSGVIYYKGKNIKECFKKVDEISNEISELFNAKRNDYTNKHEQINLAKAKAKLLILILPQVNQ